MEINSKDSIFRVTFQHGATFTMFAPSFTLAVQRSVKTGNGQVRAIRLASNREIRRYFGGKRRTPEVFKHRAAVGQQPLSA